MVSASAKFLNCVTSCYQACTVLKSDWLDKAGVVFKSLRVFSSKILQHEMPFFWMLLLLDCFLYYQEKPSPKHYNCFCSRPFLAFLAVSLRKYLWPRTCCSIILKLFMITNTDLSKLVLPEKKFLVWPICTPLSVNDPTDSNENQNVSISFRLVRVC